ncbi:bifunctional glutamate N-acetyltransferase/amino-acid acetyltransferase ArgJ [Parasporobacterium paucivorans]|uniref:Arginine biosynthesis bifunctional protein ArgJ n=1 Tax=Parasporobacterium paucivorans DSM 15970 TaxID=1122934 RepID=A0A1M6G8H2_9FIRM|nr:bifunctional glutamate N-acetyltransferase/amino-acid acetyltransferase ArgJ [Parasporobacterium paucivorans]SHJ06273.1 glutamate N-acetyltransferase [Parasporobacterium paucivorans DSM 15970]
MNIQMIEGGITTPAGFKAASHEAGIKKRQKKDMAMIYSEVPCETAGTFTKNLVKAAPVIWDMNLVRSNEPGHAIVINSGVANACTGQEGYKYCEDMAKETAAKLGIKPESVYVASTGVIGKQLPMDKIISGIDVLASRLQDGKEAGEMAALAIMTTDTAPKEAAVRFEIGGKEVTIGGMCKGSGMIHPNMCTMLSFLSTDVSITKALLQEALLEAVQDTYNMVSVDGDTSTNDTVLILANGLAENIMITEKNEDYRTFLAAMQVINEYLAKKIAGDGEGATALFEVKVINAEETNQAKELAKSIVSSSLTKAAIFGHDANWGRILCAMGYSGAEFNPDKTDIYFESAAGKIKLVENGMATAYSEEEATKILSEPEVTVIADIKAGNARATAWGCDLTYDYIKINADYRS